MSDGNSDDFFFGDEADGSDPDPGDDESDSEAGLGPSLLEGEDPGEDDIRQDDSDAGASELGEDVVSDADADQEDGGFVDSSLPGPAHVWAV
jgi:hypothetical protein